MFKCDCDVNEEDEEECVIVDITMVERSTSGSLNCKKMACVLSCLASTTAPATEAEVHDSAPSSQ